MRVVGNAILRSGLMVMSFCLLFAPAQPQAAEDTGKPVAAEPTYRQWSRARQLRPRRPTDPLREANIADEEVRQIEGAARAVFPTAMVNISGVTTGYPCEDGPGCTDQVWVVAWQSEESRGLMRERMSLIESFPQCEAGASPPGD